MGRVCPHIMVRPGPGPVVPVEGREPRLNRNRRKIMSLGTILLVILVLILLGILPTWPHSRSWGYGPSGAIGAVVIILLILVLMGRL